MLSGQHGTDSSLLSGMLNPGNMAVDNQWKYLQVEWVGEWLRPLI